MVSRKETRTLDGHEPCGVASFAFRSDSRAIISVGLHDKKVKVWDVATGKNTATFAIQPDDFIAEALSPDGKMLALAYRDKTVKLFDVKAAAEEPDFDAVVLIEGKGRDISLLYVVLTERRKVDHDIQNDLVAKYAKAALQAAEEYKFQGTTKEGEKPKYNGNVVFFIRPGGHPNWGYQTGFGVEQLQTIVVANPEEARKLASDHAWVLGQIPEKK